MGAGRAEEEQEARLPRRSLALIFALALGLRLVALAELHGSPWNDVPLGDARHFDEWGQRIAAGEWLGREVFYQAPLYPYVLGVLYRLFGHAPELVRVLQCLAGACGAIWSAAATCRLGSARAGLLAGILAALYAPAIWYDLQLEKTAFAGALTALLTYAALARGACAGWALGAGLALGALALLRENAAVLVLPLAWAFARERDGRARRVALLLGAFLLVLAPVGLRNRALGGTFLPTSANAGVNFYIGNGAEADGLYRPLVAGRGHPDHEAEDARAIAERLSGRTLTPAGVSRFWLGRAGDEIRAEPGHFVRLLAHKARLLLQPREIMDAVAFEVFADESVVLRVLGWLSFGLLAPLSLAGAVLVLGRRNAGVTLAMAGLLALSIVAFFVVGRFRLGLVPILVPLAAVASTELRSSTRRVPALAALVACGLLVAWPLATEGDPRATSASNLASELLRRNDPAGAERWARTAREQDPRSADAAYNLGLALRGQGRNDEAVEPFEAAQELEPAYAADCLAELGALRALAGDAAGARELLERALALDREHAAARRYLAALEKSQRSE